VPLALTRHRTGVSIGVSLGMLGAVHPLLRRPILTWGATRDEACSRLPGDELLEDADGVSTRAITMRLTRIEPGRVLSWRSEDGN
jgi:hypothetical protein